LAFVSHVFSVAASGYFPLARPMWHFTSPPASFAVAFATRLSHLVMGPLGASNGIVPVSSPPNGVCAQTATTGMASASVAISAASCVEATVRATRRLNDMGPLLFTAGTVNRQGTSVLDDAGPPPLGVMSTSRLLGVLGWILPTLIGPSDAFSW